MRYFTRSSCSRIQARREALTTPSSGSAKRKKPGVRVDVDMSYCPPENHEFAFAGSPWV